MKIKTPKYKYNKVLLIDDNELDNFINEKIIESAHFAKKVYVNTSSKSALEFLNNIELLGEQSAGIFPELIFIDLNMPIIDGFQFINYLKSMTGENIKKCKMVILTSSVHPDDRKMANKISPDIVFLNKPLTEAMLVGL
jgi:CheY-like chemotaxis protein